MELVREQLGAEAIIVATHEDEGTRGVRVTAAMEISDTEPDFSADEAPVEVVDVICTALDDHGTPPEVADRILNAASTLSATAAGLALAGALDANFAFAPLPEAAAPKPLMMIGPPGVGKTAGVAKLAARAVLAETPVSLITTDMVRACAVEQLEAYAGRLDLVVKVAPDPVALIEAIEASGADDLILIDSMSVNPYSDGDMTALKDFTEATALEPVLVMSAGRDAVDAAELANAFSEFEPGRMMVTGLDMAHRLGSMLAVADAAKIPFSDVSPTPAIVNGLRPLNPVSLARLLLPMKEEEVAAPTEEGPESPENPLEATGSELFTMAVHTLEQTSTDSDTGGNLIAVASGKGGVGKTWFSITLAHAISRANRKALLFDGDLGLANVDIQLGLMTEHDLASVFAGKITLRQTISNLPDAAFDIIAGRSGSGSLAALPAPRLRTLRDELLALSKDYDHVVVDLGAGLDRTVRLLAAEAGTCIVLATDDPTSLTDAYAFIKVTLAERPEADLRLVVNLAESRSAGEKTYETLLTACRNFLQFEPPLAGVIRRDNRVREAIRNQTALLTRSPNCEAASDVEAIANGLLGPS